MSEIILYKRCKYASDVFYALVEKCGFPMEEASNLLNSIPDVNIEEELPTVEAKPVVHGEWIEKWDREHFFSSCICSNCGKGTCRDSLMKWVKGAFCQNCGADMRGGKNE